VKVEELVPDELWELIRPLLPPPKPRRRRNPGRKPLDPRKALTGILFVLRSGIPWEMLPQEMGCGCGMSCWRYLRLWQQTGTWKKIHELLLAKLQGANKIDFSRVVVDSASVRAVLGGTRRGRTQRIVRRKGQSTISSSRRRVFPWPSKSPRPIATT
jgi:transposase